ncbi:MAG TPA: NUMOD4 domain-containing protein [Flavitalea sp.]|nr:NUMOD4 domain-containing protein [Flavitalea sp.]
MQNEETAYQIWKPIKGYENIYEISQDGLVRSLDRFVKISTGGLRFYRGQPIKTKINNHGYVSLELSKGGEKHTFFIHRLLIDAFKWNLKKKCCVNHLNGNKQDNTHHNLEYVTVSENIKHAYKNNLIKAQGTKVKDVCTGVTYDSVKEAALAAGLNYATCKNYLNGNRRNPTCLRIL